MVNENFFTEFKKQALNLGAQLKRFSDFSSLKNFLSEFCVQNKIKKIIADTRTREKFRDTSQIPLLIFQNPREALSADVGIMFAEYGISETGTLVQVYENDLEKLPGMLPTICFCILPSEKIVPRPETILDFISLKLKQGKQVAFLSGPSRTADIECQSEIGVHGPSQLWILLLDEDTDDKN